MTLKQQLLHDLENKLKDDIKHAILRFLDMCETCDVDTLDAMTAVVSTTLGKSLELALRTGVPPHILVESIEVVKRQIERRP